MSDQRRAGTIYIKVDGVQHDAKGSFTYNHGAERRSPILGSDRVHGYAAAPQVPFIEGAITDGPNVDVPALKAVDDATVTLELANGKTFVLRNAWYASEGNVTTEQGEIPVRWEGMSATEF